MCICYYYFIFWKYKGKQLRLKIARNLVDYEAGKTILDTALGIITKQDTKQTELFWNQRNTQQYKELKD